MKILWFSNTPGLASEYLYSDNLLKTGSWMYKINEEIAKKVNLYVVFPGKEKNKFTYKNTTFIEFPLIKWNLYKKLVNKLYLIDYDLHYIKKELKKIVDNVQPNIIHSFGTELPWGLIQEVTKIPTIISIQGNLNVYYDFFYSGITKYDILKFADIKTKKNIFLNNTFMKKRKKIEKRILKQARYIIGRTEWDKRITRILSPHSKYYYNDETLRENFYKTKWIPLPISSKVKLFTINRDSTYKGFETIFKASLLLENIGFNFEWHIGGINKDSWMIKILRKKFDTMPASLIFHGVMSEMEIIEQISKSNIYIMPSHIENSPLTLSEAMIMGIPIIATLAGGVSSRLKDKKEGLVIQAGDAFSLAGAITETVENYEKAIEMGLNAKKTAQKRHDVNNIVSDLMNIYYNILENLNE